jgi:hypothetical protein
VTWVRENGPKAVLEVAINLAAPFLIYSVAKRPLGDVYALMAASVPAILWSVIAFARTRRVDALSVLVLAGIALSLLAFIGGGGVRFLQLREQLVAGAIGLVFLGSAAIGKPLIYQLARARVKRRSASEAQSFEALSDSPLFRRAMMLMTLVWGVGLVAEAAVCSTLVFLLTPQQFLLASPVIGYTTLATITVWSFWYARRRADAARAADSGVR